MALRLGEWVVDVQRRRLVGRDGSVSLTDAEAAILAHLIAHAGEVVTRETLLQEVLGFAPSVATRAADSAVFRLRQKVEPNPADPIYILSVRGTGYRFVPPEAGDDPATPSPEPVRERVLDTFVGRGAERARVVECLRGGALVTLAGPGGVGKTRLALEVARSWGAGRVIVCDCAEAHDADGLWEALGKALGAPPTADGVRRYVSVHEGLLVVDNLEQAQGAAGVVAQLVAGVASILATSRHELGIRGEVVVRLSGLAGDEASQLLKLRAEARGGATAWDPHVAQRLVGRLDGLPLAIELAASRLGPLGLRELDRALDGPRSVRADDPSRPERHRALEALFDWGFALLAPREVIALGALASVPGDMGMGLAIAVLEQFLAPADEPLDVLQALVAKSWVQASDHAMGARFGVLGTARAFVGARTEPGTQERAMHAVVAWALRSDSRDELGACRGPVVGAFAWAVEHDTEAALTLVPAIRVLLQRGGLGPGFDALRRLSECPLETTVLAQVRATYAQALVARRNLPEAARQSSMAWESLEALEPQPHGVLTVVAQVRALIDGLEHRVDDALRWCEAARTHAEAVGNVSAMCLADGNAALQYLQQGDPESARRVLERLRRDWPRDPTGWVEAMTRLRCAAVDFALGELDSSERHALLARAVFVRLGLERSTAWVDLRIGMVALERGDLARAEEAVRNARDIARAADGDLIAAHADTWMHIVRVARCAPEERAAAARRALVAVDLSGAFEGPLPESAIALARLLAPTEPGLALEIVREAAEVANRSGDRHLTGVASCVSAGLHLDRGDTDEASACLARAQEVARGFEAFPKSFIAREVEALRTRMAAINSRP